MEPPGCPDPASVVIFKMSPLANLANSVSLFRETSSSLSASNLFPFIAPPLLYQDAKFPGVTLQRGGRFYASLWQSLCRRQGKWGGILRCHFPCNIKYRLNSLQASFMIWSMVTGVEWNGKPVPCRLRGPIVRTGTHPTSSIPTLSW